MSRTPSSTPPRRSSAARAEAPPDDEAYLIAAGRFLIERRSFGMVWIDSNLVAQRCFGPLVDFVVTGLPITESIVALIGLEEDMAALREGSDGPLTMPNVVMSTATPKDLRLSFDLHWVEAEQTYVMLVRNVMDHSSLETELRTQTRLRAIAEAELAGKSREIQRANLELALVNRDLEEFAYVISHDLKAPLRALRFDSADADRALAEGNIDAAGAKLTAMRGHQARMLAMLNGLFDYARAGRKVEGIAMADTRQLIEDVVAGLALPAGMTVTIEGRWPHLMTLAAPLELVLRNLIGNAVKHHDRPDGHILVSAHISDDNLDITVRDDGRGIAPDWHEAVFLPFRKVDDTGDTEDSSGMGLALVRRTLDRIGGTISLQSDAPRKRGTSFLVRWPKRIDA